MNGATLGTLVPITFRLKRAMNYRESIVAVSKKRDKNVYKAPRNLGKPPSENPKWLLPVIGTLLVVGVLWILVYYISAARYPIAIGNWNLIVGFAMLTTAMMLTTRWK